MLIVANKTEYRLVQDLKKCLKSDAGRLFFYLGFSNLQTPKQTLFEMFLNELEEVPKSYMAQVYLCDDGDVVIMMKPFMKEQFLGFVKNLGTLVEEDGVMDVVEIMDSNIDGERLEVMFQTKLDAIYMEQEEEREKKRQARAEIALQGALEKMDASKISDIGLRRRSRKSVNILIVDDDQLLRTLAGNVLNTDFDVAMASDGEAALLQFVDVAPDVVFLDIGLPDMTGHEVLEQIFQIDPEAYVIMFSGRKDKENMLKALRLGACGFVGKPFTRNKMHHYVQQCPFVIEKLPPQTLQEKAQA